MNKQIFLYFLCAVAVLFSFALIENKTQVSVLESFSVNNVEDTAKNLIRPLAYKAGLLEKPVVVQRSDFIDRERLFVKQVTDNGDVSMVEVSDGSLRRYFDDNKTLLIEGDRDVILELFDETSSDRRIIYNRSDADFPINLLKMLSSVVKHGSRDDVSKYDDLLKTLHGRSLVMTCGSISVFVQRVLSDIGIKSRVATALTLSEWTTYDNGHTFLEVYLPQNKKWVAIDIDAKVFFSTPEVDRASLLDMINSGVDKLSFTTFLNISTLDYSSFEKYQIIGDFVFLNKKDWYSRVLQVFALYDDTIDKYVFAADDEKTVKRIESYDSRYTTLPREVFIKRFYGMTKAEQAYVIQHVLENKI